MGGTITDPGGAAWGCDKQCRDGKDYSTALKMLVEESYKFSQPAG